MKLFEWVVIKTDGGCLNVWNFITVKSPYCHWSPLKILPTHFEHTWPSTLDTFWSSYRCRHLCCPGCLSGLNLFKILNCPAHTEFGEEPQLSQCQNQWIRWMKTLLSLPSIKWHSAAMFTNFFFFTSHKDGYKEDLQNCSRKYQNDGVSIFSVRENILRD